MADNPGDWMSYADFLGLNEASLRELEDAAQQRAAQADEMASSALGKAYQQASADVESGGEGNLSQAQGYMDFVKAQREAASARALPSSAGAYEQAGRMGLRGGATQPHFQQQQSRMRADLSGRRDAVAAGRAAQKAYADRRAAEREAQAKAFGEARQRMGIDDAAGAQYRERADAINRSARRGTIGASGAYDYDRTR